MTAVLFQNCGRISIGNGFSTEEMSSLEAGSESLTTGDLCEDVLMKEFLRPQGYYEFLSDTRRCGNCHEGSRPAAPPFIHANKLIAWDTFFQKELQDATAVSNKAVSDHQPGYTGSQNAPYIEELKREMLITKKEYNACKGIVEAPTKILTTTALSMEFAVDTGTPLTVEETAFTRTETATYYEAGKYVTQTFTLNPYQRIIYDAITNRWKSLQLKKFINPDLTAEEKSHVRTENFTYILNGVATTKSFTLNPYQRVVVNSTTKVPEMKDLPRTVEKKFNLRSGVYTPSVVGDEPYLEFSVEAFRSHDVTPVRKTFSITEIGGKVVSVSRAIGYTQTLDPYIVIRNPSFRMTQNMPNIAYAVQGLSILVNNALRPEATIYSILEGNICTTTKITLMSQNNSQILVFSKILSTDKLSFKFNDITSLPKTASLVCSTNNSTVPVLNLPTSVTYTQLIGTTDLGVFRTQCLNCHNSVELRGAFDISNYDSAKAKAAKILDRMNDAGAPMPQSGLLDLRSRELVRKWISLGSPR